MVCRPNSNENVQIIGEDENCRHDWSNLTHNRFLDCENKKTMIIENFECNKCYAIKQIRHKFT